MPTETTINTINTTTRAAHHVTITAGNLAIMAALTSAWNTLTPGEQQQFNKEIGNTDNITVTFTLAGENPRLTDTNNHTHTSSSHPLAHKYLHALTGYLARINTHTIYEYETWRGADEQTNKATHALHHTRQQLARAHHQYQQAKTALAQLSHQ